MATGPARFCPQCGTPREEAAIRFCRSCGAAFADAARPELAEARRRPLLVVGLLSFLSSGLYPWIWTWMSWRELKRLTGDAGMRPFWHSLAIFVPVYGYFRFHAHYRVLDERARTTGGRLDYSPLIVTAVYVALTVVGYAVTGAALSDLDWITTGATPPVLQLFSVVSGLVYAFFVVVGQRALSQHYAAIPDASVPERARTAEWVFVVIFALLFAAQFASPPELAP